jgi:hypothetical protein
VYDIENRRVLGQVTNGWPEMLFDNPPRLLCSQTTEPAGANGSLERLRRLLAKISFGRISYQPPPLPCVTYWVLDLENNAATRLGDIRGTPNFSFFASPDGHYCFTIRVPQPPFPNFYLLDLQKGLIRNLEMVQWPCDWWDNTHILLRTTNCDLVLYDVVQEKVSPLVEFGKMATFLRTNGITDDPTITKPFATWNGRENDFYLTDTHQRWLAEESFLVKLERPDGALKMVSPHFKFEWSDELDPTGHLYIYSGRDVGQASDGVFLRDLASGTNRILVEPDTNRYFSIPRFYRDSIIYIRSNALWQISLDGATNTRLFPPIPAVER